MKGFWLYARICLSVLSAAYFLKTVFTLCCVERLKSRIPETILYMFAFDEGSIVYWTLSMILLLPTFAVLVVRQIIRKENLRAGVLHLVTLLLGCFALWFWLDFTGYL